MKKSPELLIYFVLMGHIQTGVTSSATCMSSLTGLFLSALLAGHAFVGRQAGRDVIAF